MNISISVKRDVTVPWGTVSLHPWPGLRLSVMIKIANIPYNTILCQSTSLGGTTPPRSGIHCNNKPTAAFETCR